jgi:hypothetical protein
VPVSLGQPKILDNLPICEIINPLATRSAKEDTARCHEERPFIRRNQSFLLQTPQSRGGVSAATFRFNDLNRHGKPPLIAIMFRIIPHFCARYLGQTLVECEVWCQFASHHLVLPHFNSHQPGLTGINRDKKIKNFCGLIMKTRHTTFDKPLVSQAIGFYFMGAFSAQAILQTLGWAYLI